MSLPQQIDSALVMALLDGAFESPPWSAFLRRLKAVTSADFVTLHFCPPGRPLEDTLDLFAGNVPMSTMLEIARDYFHSDEMAMPMRLVEGRPYTLEELLDLHDGLEDSLRQLFMDKGISGIRQMRLREATGVDAWLTIIRLEGDFSPVEEAVMCSIGPVLRGVLRQYVALERERFAGHIASEATNRLRFGWLALGATGQLLDWDEQGLRIMEESEVLGKNASGHLVARSSQIQREMTKGLSRIAQNPGSRAYAITLRRDPWLDMLLVPTTRRSISTGGSPAVIAYIHGDSWHSADCCEQLAELFALTPSESRLALAVCRGMSIAEAAGALGISVGTARSYSKSIYAKTGARGLPDLVRIVMRSVLAIAQEP